LKEKIEKNPATQAFARIADYNPPKYGGYRIILYFCTFSHPFEHYAITLQNTTLAATMPFVHAYVCTTQRGYPIV
jgi:hypothetical protein